MAIVTFYPSDYGMDVDAEDISATALVHVWQLVNMQSHCQLHLFNCKNINCYIGTCVIVRLPLIGSAPP